MYYVYVIQSLSHGTRYVGSAKNITKRIQEHNNGLCRYTSGRKPWKLVFTKEHTTRSEAMRREKFLKTGQGRKWLDEILNN